MEGLEVSVLKKSEALLDNGTLRIDPEYFIKDAVRAYHLLSGQARFGTMVKSGYRVVYENTKVVEREGGIDADLPFFLQSADITTPFINEGALSCVPESDWVRYPKGRIIPGELLVEVKGKAEKVAIVPDDFPVRTLVTGTCFKISPISPSHRSLMLAYLMSDHGAVLKNRLKTNLLVSYIAKDDLYRLPFPNISEPLRLAVHEKVQASLDCRKEILGKQAEAEATLLAALGLAGWSPPEPLSYTARAADAHTAARLDAQYFMPSKLQMIEALQAMPGQSLGARFKSVREMFDPAKADPDLLVRNFDLPDALEPILDDDKELASSGDIGSLKKGMKNGDVAMSRLRAYLRETAVVRTGASHLAVGSSEFIVLRPVDPKANRIAPETLMIFLRSAPVQTILKWCQDGSQHPRFSERDLLAIPLPDAVADASTEIEEMVQSAFTARARSRALLSSAKRAVEIAIEDSEAAALAFLAG